ncbi:hypothetical protein AAC387_Pa03g0819 [Persea americana]
MVISCSDLKEWREGCYLPNQVRRVQKYVETLDLLRIRNAMPNRAQQQPKNSVFVMTKWETFDPTAATSSSSNHSKLDWEFFNQLSLLFSYTSIKCLWLELGTLLLFFSTLTDPDAENPYRNHWCSFYCEDCGIKWLIIVLTFHSQ